jgi:AraC-like DNA-binding protein
VQFRKLFRRVTGSSPARYIQSRRIERACRTLRESDASVEEAALAAGFSDSAFFCRVFKMWTRTTPTEYRKSAL